MRSCAQVVDCCPLFWGGTGCKVSWKTVTSTRTELEEEHSSEDGAFAELEKINKGEVTKQLEKIKGDNSYQDEEEILKQWVGLEKQQAAFRKKIKETEKTLDLLAYEKYPTLTPDEVKKNGS